jgi:opacity protein-like surface antigen
MAAIRRARADGKEAEAFGRADRLAVDCAREAQIRKDLQVISMDVDRNKDRLPSDAAARFYELLRTGDYSNALLCGEALLRGAAERCAFASGHGTVATGDADEELWTAPEEDTDPGPPVRSNRLILSVGFGVGSANLSGVHDGAADVATAFETQNPGLSLDGEPQSSLQINWGVEARYYLPYYLFAQLGFGSLYNRAASDFGSGTLTNENWALELPILVGFYYLMKEHFCLFGALGPSVLLWSRSIWSSDPGGAPDFKSDAAVGAHFLAGLDYVFNDRWALGIDLRYRLLRAGELKNVKTDEPLRSGQLLGDPTRRTYDLDFSGFSGTFSMRVFVL